MMNYLNNRKYFIITGTSGVGKTKYNWLFEKKNIRKSKIKKIYETSF